MSCNRGLLMFVVGAMVLGPSAVGRGQFGGGGGVGGGPSVIADATEVIMLRPTEYRMTVQLTEKGANLKDVLAKLKARSDAAAQTLTKLGATKDSVHATAPELAAENSQRELQMRQMRMMRAMQRGGGKPPKGLDVPKSVSAVVQVTATWSLEGKKHEEVLFFCHDLKTKVANADLAGLKEAKKLTPEEEELAEEAEQMGMGMGSEEANPGEPTFVFVARIADAQKQQATKQAFAKAKAKAEQLATAAGTTLGKLTMLSSTASEMPEADSMDYQMNYMLRQRMRRSADTDQESEAISGHAAEAKVHVMVHVAFELN